MEDIFYSKDIEHNLIKCIEQYLDIHYQTIKENIIKDILLEFKIYLK